MSYTSADTYNQSSDIDSFLVVSRFDTSDFFDLNGELEGVVADLSDSSFVHNKICEDSGFVNQQGENYQHFNAPMDVDILDSIPRAMSALESPWDDYLLGTKQKSTKQIIEESEQLIKDLTCPNEPLVHPFDMRSYSEYEDSVMVQDPASKAYDIYDTISPDKFWWDKDAADNEKVSFRYEQPSYQPIYKPAEQVGSASTSFSYSSKAKRGDAFTGTTKDTNRYQEPESFSVGQKLIDQQLRQSIEGEVYRKLDSHRGCIKDLSTAPSTLHGVFKVPNNTAFLKNGFFCNDMPRDAIPQRLRYQRGPDFKYKQEGYHLNYHSNKDRIYDPEYTIVKMNACNNVMVPDNKTREALCPYCKDVKFFLLKDSAYGNHMATDHGILTDSYITPDPFKSSKRTPSKGRNVTCPVCAKDIVVAKSSATAQNRPLYSYLRHFKYEHQKADKANFSELDRFKRMKFDV